MRIRPRLAIYLRLSNVTDTTVSISRQWHECLRFVEELKGVFNAEIDVYIDRVSAAKGLYRKGMEDLLCALEEDRAYDGVVVWEFSRALRNQAEALNLKAIFRQASCELYVVTNPSITLWGNTAFLSEFWVEIAAGETKAMSDRAKSRHHFLSAFGAARCRPVFGMKTATVAEFIPGRAAPIRKFVPDEDARPELGGNSRADLVRYAARGMLEGRTMHGIAVEWNEAGYRGANGAKWCTHTIHNVLTSPTIAGLAHRGLALLGSDGEVLEPDSDDEPLVVSEGAVSVDDWMLLHEGFKSRRRTPNRRTEPPLVGLVKCSRCGDTIERRGHRYVCADERTGYVTCGKANTMAADRLERVAVSAAMRMLESGPLRAAAWDVNQPERVDKANAVEAKIARVNARLAKIEGFYLEYDEDNDEDGRTRMLAQRATARADLTALKEELTGLKGRRRGRRSHVDDLYSSDKAVVKAFDDAPYHLRVTILQELIEVVLLHPSTKATKHDPGRVEVVFAQRWRQTASATGAGATAQTVERRPARQPDSAGRPAP